MRSTPNRDDSIISEISSSRASLGYSIMLSLWLTCLMTEAFVISSPCNLQTKVQHQRQAEGCPAFILPWEPRHVLPTKPLSTYRAKKSSSLNMEECDVYGCSENNNKNNTCLSIRQQTVATWRMCHCPYPDTCDDKVDDCDVD
jgi:hypothetical protein